MRLLYTHSCTWQRCSLYRKYRALLNDRNEMFILFEFDRMWEWSSAPNIYKPSGIPCFNAARSFHIIYLYAPGVLATPKLLFREDELASFHDDDDRRRAPPSYTVSSDKTTTTMSKSQAVGNTYAAFCVNSLRLLLQSVTTAQHNNIKNTFPIKIYEKSDHIFSGIYLRVCTSNKVLVGSNVILLILLTSGVRSDNDEKRVVCYYTNWSVYRPGTAKFQPDNINPYLCTHLIYAFGGFTKENALKPFDKYQDVDKGGYAKFNGLKTYNKNLKTLLAVGGWNEGSKRFSPMVADTQKRKQFVKSAVKFLRQNRFDGLDLDWEYPAHRDGGKPRDKDNYATLVQELREEFDKESSKTGKPRLLLTMAIPAGIETLEKGYDIPRLNEYLDFFNLLSYDYHSAYEPAANHHAPLYGLEEDNEYNYDNELTIAYTIKYLTQNGATADKIVVGIPTYGRSYTLINADATELGAPADGPGEEGEATREKGYLAYYEICENIDKNDWTVENPNPNAMGPYAFKDNQWVGYDDEDIRRKRHCSKTMTRTMKTTGQIPLVAKRDHECQKIKNQSTAIAVEALIRERQLLLLDPHRQEDRSNQELELEQERVLQHRSQLMMKTRLSNNDRDNKRKPPTRTSTNQKAVTSNKKTTTTPAPPTTPDPGSDFKCEDEGFFPHPRDCKKYFWCLDSGPSGLGIVANQFNCPSGLVFNKLSDSCDYPRNVVCNKAKATTTTTTTQRTTTTTKEPVEEDFVDEDVIYEDEEDIEEVEEEKVEPEKPKKITTTTARSLLYKTINRSRPASSTTTELPSSTQAPKAIIEDLPEDEQDPRVIKELIDLIKKAGGIEQLEKQLAIQEKGSADQVNDQTPPTISKSLYDRVLSQQSSKKNYFNAKTLNDRTVKFSKEDPEELESVEEEKIVRNKSRSKFMNGPGRTQFEGLDEVPEVKSLRRSSKPKYVTIERHSSSTEASNESELNEEDDDDSNTEESLPNENLNRNVPVESSSTPRSTPGYATIRRTRPSSTTSTTAASRSSDLPKQDEVDEVTPKTRYVNANRFRSTTVTSNQETESVTPGSTFPSSTSTTKFVDESSISDEKMISIDGETGRISITPFVTTESPSTARIYTDSVSTTVKTTIPIPQDSTPNTNPTTKQDLPTFTPTPRIATIVDSVTESLPSVTPSESTSRVTLAAVSQPRPFGYHRRGRPTTASPTTSSNLIRSSVVGNEPTSRTKVSTKSRIIARSTTTSAPRSTSTTSTRTRSRTRTRDKSVGAVNDENLRRKADDLDGNPSLQDQKDAEVTSRTRQLNRGPNRSRTQIRSRSSNNQETSVKNASNNDVPSRKQQRPIKTPALRDLENTQSVRITTEIPSRNRNSFRGSRTKTDQQVTDNSNKRSRFSKTSHTKSTFPSTIDTSTTKSTTTITTPRYDVIPAVRYPSTIIPSQVYPTTILSNQDVDFLKKYTDFVLSTDKSPFVIDVKNIGALETTTFGFEEETFNIMESSLQTTAPPISWKNYGSTLRNFNDESRTTILDTTINNDFQSSTPSARISSGISRFTKDNSVRKISSTSPIPKTTSDNVNARQNTAARRLRPPADQLPNSSEDDSKKATFSDSYTLTSRSPSSRYVTKSDYAITTPTSVYTTHEKRRNLLERYRTSGDKIQETQFKGDESYDIRGFYENSGLEFEDLEPSDSPGFSNNNNRVKSTPLDAKNNKTSEVRQSRTRFTQKDEKEDKFKNFTHKSNGTSRYVSKSMTSTTEKTTPESLIPTKKFDYFADAMKRGSQLQRTTPKLSGGKSIPSSTTKPLVTRLVTSIAESDVTERQRILVKKKYSSLTGTSFLPKATTVSPLLHKRQKNKQASLNEITSSYSTEQNIEWSTLPIESEFIDKRFTTEPSPESSSTIEIESVFSNLIPL
uniref:chitinase n=1 Tax=Trichogramma kaykai TaxID=54128 RepID=A0ABD2XD38_9HYME